MLLELRITDLGIIDELHLLVGPGLTAITGETGAGKTLVTGALALLAGERADAGIVRDGAAEARVEGRFEGPDGDDAIAVHSTGVLTLSWDHRAFDGAYAASFLHSLAEILEHRDWEAELA